jgi:hypothetical protein
MLHALLLFRETYHIKFERMTAIKNEKERKKKKEGFYVADANVYGEESYMSVLSLHGLNAASGYT